MGGWDDDEFSAQETCETASATGGGADTIKFKWDSDPCQGESVTRCRSIHFRYIYLTYFESLAHRCDRDILLLIFSSDWKVGTLEA